MDNIVKLHDKTFRLSIDSTTIDRVIARLAGEINSDASLLRPLFLSVLNGAFMFTSDLLKQITIEGTAVAFTRLASYAGTASTGTVRELIGITEEIAGRDVIIIEDIVDTGRSLAHLLDALRDKSPRQVKIAALFYKPDALERDVTVHYAGIPLANDFVVGRGLDYDGLGRNLPHLYTLVQD